MDDTKTATEAPGQAIAPDIEKTDENVEPELGVDAEQKIAELEKEKNRVIEESANYRLAYLKEKKRQSRQDSDIVDEDEDDKIRRIANEALANSRLAEIAREQDSIIKQALKENRELKLAQMKPSSAPSSIGSHTESKSRTVSGFQS